MRRAPNTPSLTSQPADHGSEEATPPTQRRQRHPTPPAEGTLSHQTHDGCLTAYAAEAGGGATERLNRTRRTSAHSLDGGSLG